MIPKDSGRNGMGTFHLWETLNLREVPSFFFPQIQNPPRMNNDKPSRARSEACLGACFDPGRWYDRAVAPNAVTTES